MTYLEYMKTHENENLGWCKPYVDNSGNYFAIMYEGNMEWISMPDTEALRYDGSLTNEVLEAFARSVNPDYDVYSGWTDVHIALDAMREIGCSECPFRCDCDAMLEDIEDY